jgi:hypothetical protein
MRPDVTVTIVVNTTHVVFRDNLVGCPDVAVRDPIGMSRVYHYLGSDNDRGDWFAWDSVRVRQQDGVSIAFEDDFESALLSMTVWTRELSNTVPPSYNVRFLDSGELRMTGTVRAPSLIVECVRLCTCSCRQADRGSALMGVCTTPMHLYARRARVPADRAAARLCVCLLTLCHVICHALLMPCSQHKVMMAADRAFSNTFFDLTATVTRNTHTG